MCIYIYISCLKPFIPLKTTNNQNKTSLFSVSLQVSVKGVIRGSAVLPCSSKESLLTVERITVNWKQNDRLTVYGIDKGKVFVEGQATVFNNRTESFPEQYLRGNFSIKLNNLQYTDAGKYQCYIIEESTIQTVQLLIEGLCGVGFIYFFLFLFKGALVTKP